MAYYVLQADNGVVREKEQLSAKDEDQVQNLANVIFHTVMPH
jgi:hypothetical protein